MDGAARVFVLAAAAGHSVAVLHRMEEADAVAAALLVEHRAPDLELGHRYFEVGAFVPAGQSARGQQGDQ